MLKTFVGTVVGVVFGAALLAALGMFGVRSLWPAVAVGIVCGFAMRWTTKSGVSNSYVNGGLSACAVVAAIIAGNLLIAAMLERAESATAVSTGPRATGIVVDADGTDADLEGSPPPKPADVQAIGSSSRGRPAGQGDFSLFDGIWMAVGALIAYELGKGETFGLLEKRKREAAANEVPDESTPSSS